MRLWRCPDQDLLKCFEMVEGLDVHTVVGARFHVVLFFVISRVLHGCAGGDGSWHTWFFDVRY